MHSVYEADEVQKDFADTAVTSVEYEVLQAKHFRDMQFTGKHASVAMRHLFINVLFTLSAASSILSRP